MQKKGRMKLRTRCDQSNVVSRRQTLQYNLISYLDISRTRIRPDDEISVQLPPKWPVITENMAGFILPSNFRTVRYKLPNWDGGGAVFAKVRNGGWLQA
jgi:hypothetical protein